MQGAHEENGNDFTSREISKGWPNSGSFEERKKKRLESTTVSNKKKKMLHPGFKMGKVFVKMAAGQPTNRGYSERMRYCIKEKKQHGYNPKLYLYLNMGAGKGCYSGIRM